MVCKQELHQVDQPSLIRKGVYLNTKQRYTYFSTFEWQKLSKKTKYVVLKTQQQ